VKHKEVLNASEQKKQIEPFHIGPWLTCHWFLLIPLWMLYVYTSSYFFQKIFLVINGVNSINYWWYAGKTYVCLDVSTEVSLIKLASQTTISSK